MGALHVFYGLVACVVACGFYALKQRASVRKREADFRLEQRRRQGIPDEDKRPYEVALKDVLERKRRIERDRARSGTPQAGRDERKEFMREVDAGVRSRGSLAGRKVERVEGRSRTPVRRQDSPRKSPRRQVSQAQPTRSREVSSKQQPAVKQHSVTPRAAIPDHQQEHAADPAAHGKRRKRDDSDEESEPDAGGYERTKGRAIRRRRNPPDQTDQTDRETAADPSGTDKEMVPNDDATDADSEAEEQRGQLRQATMPASKGKKRELDDVDADAESSVGRRRRPKRGRVASRTASASEGQEQDGAETGEREATDHDMGPSPAASDSARSDSVSESEPEELVLRTRRGTARRAPPRATPRRTRSKPSAKAEITDGQRKPMEEWTDAGGIRWMIGKDGVKRRAVAVKEMRNKYDMPRDSKHPDRLVMHKVLVEKWLTDDEFQSARKAKKLGWQSDDEDSSTAVEAAPAASTPNRSLYYSTGTMSPRRGPLQAAASALRNVTPGVRLDLSRVGSPTSSAGTPNRYSPMLRGKSSLRQLRQKPVVSEAEDRERARKMAERIMRETGEEVGPAPVQPQAQGAHPPVAPSPATAQVSFPPAAADAAPPASAAAAASTSTPSFSFGSSAPAAAAPPTIKADQPPASNPFGGLNSTNSKASPAPSASSFAFGTPTPAAGNTSKDAPKTAEKPPAAAPAPAAPASFSFGAPSKPSTPFTSTSAPAFSFGPASLAAASKPADKPATSGGFSFGAPAPAAVASTGSSAPSGSSDFTFGAQPAQGGAGKTAAFGAAPPSNPFGPAIEPAKPTSAAAAAPPAMTFGAPRPAVPAAVPSSASFTFGSAASPAPSSPFGVQQATAPAPAPPSMSFGAPATPPAAGGFTFSAGSNAPMFSAGSGTPPPPGADGQRVVKGNRRLAKSKNTSTFAQGSPAPGTPPPNTQPFNFKF